MVPGPPLRRRALLAGTAGTLAATSGCVGELRNLLGREGTQQLSLSIATLPASDDPYAVRVANRLAEGLEMAGIDPLVDLMNADVLAREVLVNQNFDLYVTRYPGQSDPDELRTLLHSSYGEEAGWQNPFGFSNLTVDELLDEQRDLEGEARVETVGEILSAIVREQPFTVVAFPDRIAGFRTDRFTRWPAGGPSETTDYLRLRRVGEADTIQLLLRDSRVTRNRNPIAVEHRKRGDIIGLLYDSLVMSISGETDPIPWLAERVEWTDDGSLAAMVTLRETPWHDDEPVTASDVAFTYGFLKDTSLGEFESPAPTTWRRGRISLVDSVEVLSENEFRMTFTTSNRTVARRALDVPILPEHIWRERTGPADLAGIDLGGQTTEALVTSNEEAIGSGVMRFVEAAADEFITLEPFEDHFLNTGDTEGIPDRFTGGLPFAQARFTITPSHDAAVQLLETNDADATADGLQAAVVPRIGRNNDISLSISRSDSFYHIGYNCRDAPLSDPRFRRVIARLLDREFLVTSEFGGYAEPSETPLKPPWVPPALEWDGTANLPFFGTDGQLDVEEARDAFREAGYQYENDQLVRRNPS